MYCFRSSLSVVSIFVGTGINRYYYKKIGIDQLPFKGTFKTIYTNIKVCLINRNDYFIFFLNFFLF